MIEYDEANPSGEVPHEKLGWSMLDDPEDGYLLDNLLKFH